MADATYKVTELAAQARQIFGTATIQEAKETVEAFLNKEVR